MTLPHCPRLIPALLLCVAVLPPPVMGQSLVHRDFRADPDFDLRPERMLQGQDGRMWIGDDLGLWVYDGFERRAFEAGPGSVEPRPAGPVRSMLFDSAGRLWIGQFNALVVLDPASEEVLRVYRHVPGDSTTLLDGDVSALMQADDGRIWAGSLRWSDPRGGGLNILTAGEDGFERFRHDPDNESTISHNRVRSLAQDAEGRVWVGTWAGLNRTDRHGSAFVRYLPDSSDPSSLAYGDVKEVHVARDGTLWVVTIGGGLDRYDEERDAFDHIPTPGSGMLSSIVEERDGRLWVGTIDSGLLTLDPGGSALRQVDLAPVAENSVRIGTLAISRDRVLWVPVLTSEAGGEALLWLDLDAPQFALRRLANTLALAEGADGTNWAGGHDTIWRWDPATDSVTAFGCGDWTAASPDSFVSAIVVDPFGAVWTAIWESGPGNGLCRLPPGGDAFEPIDPDQELFADVSDAEWWEGRLWIAAAGSLLSIDSETGRHESMLPEAGARDLPDEGRARRLAVDRVGDLWIATHDGSLLRRSAGSGETHSFGAPFGGQPTRDRGLITHMEAGRDGTVWLSSGGYGLCAFRPEAGRCGRIWTSRDGLPGDYVTSAVEDSRGHVWVTTRLGLAELDPLGGSVRRISTPTRAERAQYREGSAFVNRTGTVHFGTGAGIVSFDPDDARGNQRPPEARITRVEVAGASVPDPPTRPHEVAGRTMELSSDLDDVVFEFVGLHYADPASNTYAYRLDGLDEDWRDVGTERRARFTNLSPGHYRFRVRAASANGVVGEEASYSFRILAPWWKRPWALLLWASVVAGAAASATMLRKRQLRLAHALDAERQSASRLRELSEARARMFANLSHEYRSPLGLILGQIAAVRDGGTEFDDRLEMAERQTRQLQRLTDELLDLSKVEAGALRLKRRPLDLGRVVRRVVADFASAAEEAGVDLRSDVPERPLNAMCDQDRMVQVVGNLIANAVKFTSSGGHVRVEVEDVEEASGSFVLISVEDSGVGIPHEAVPLVFDRFYRATVEDGDARGGTGIGLAFVKEVVELHDGTVSVASEVGRGARFEVRVPMVDLETGPPIAPRPDAGTPATGNASDDDAARPILLVVEDDSDTRTFLRQELEDLYRVEVAEDGDSGFAQAIDLVPDLVLTDLMMPGADGYAVVERLRSDTRTSHIPIIMLTGRASEDGHVEGFDKGVDEYLVKPVSTRVLRSRIANLLELRRLLQDRFAGELWLRPSEVAVDSTLDEQFLERVVATIEARLPDRDFSVDELAAAVSMSRSQLHRKLKALVGQAPGSLIRGMRLKRASELIRSGGHTLGQISYRTGFADQAHFTRSFRKHFGCTPTEYRTREAQ